MFQYLTTKITPQTLQSRVSPILYYTLNNNEKIPLFGGNPKLSAVNPYMLPPTPGYYNEAQKIFYIFC